MLSAWGQRGALHVSRNGGHMVPQQHLLARPLVPPAGQPGGLARERAAATSQEGGASSTGSIDWAHQAFPSYLQNLNDKKFPCQEELVAVPSTATTSSPTEGSRTMWKSELRIWQQIREDAEGDARQEPLLSSYLYASILTHDSFGRSLAFVLANRMANATMLATQLFEIFLDVLSGDDDVRCGALADLEAHMERDPACISLCHALLYFKGYHAVQAQRIAHALWRRGQRVMALALQSRMSEVFAVDIHPAARIGKGLLLDHGTGVVIGETAVIGDNCSLLQNVTLGGTGKEVGDRHPKVGDNVLIGACATILGNITIGKGSQIAAGSLVLKAVPPHCMVAGSPAKVVGKVTGNPAETMAAWAARSIKPQDIADGKTAMPMMTMTDSMVEEDEAAAKAAKDASSSSSSSSRSITPVAMGGSNRSNGNSSSDFQQPKDTDTVYYI